MNEARFTETTYSTFLTLLTTYQTVIGIADSCTASCQAAEDAWLNAIMATGPMIEVHNFLIERGQSRSHHCIQHVIIIQIMIVSEGIITKTGVTLSSYFAHVGLQTIVELI